MGTATINKLYKDKTVSREIPGLRPLFVNDTVRLLKMTRKEQEQNKIKGFAPKWSKRLYTILRKTRLRKNELQAKLWPALKFHLKLLIEDKDLPCPSGQGGRIV